LALVNKVAWNNNNSESPGPGRYENSSFINIGPFKAKNSKNGKFGVGYERFKRT